MHSICRPNMYVDKTLKFLVVASISRTFQLIMLVCQLHRKLEGTQPGQLTQLTKRIFDTI